MAKEKPEQTPVRYEVRSQVTGAHVCGPYESRQDADRECKRLNREAASGRTLHRQPGMQDGRLNPGNTPLRQQGRPMLYEVVTTGGITVGGAV